MQKIFYISEQTAKYGSGSEETIPVTDRFQQVEKLNELLSKGWSVKEFKTDQTGSFFVLEKGQ